MTPDEQRPDFDGCRRTCRTAGAHTLIWGQCEHAAEPEPTVTMSMIKLDDDGQPFIGFDRYTAQELANLIEPALRPICRDHAVLAQAAASAIVHRHEPAEELP